MPTQFLGLCCDLTSAANGFNYYMSQQAAVRNQNSIVGYYHSNKKIWVTNGNEIKIQINANTPAKTASKNILDILKAMIDSLPPLGGTVVGGDVNVGQKRDRAEVESRDWLESRADVQPEFKRKKLTLPNNKRKHENAEMEVSRQNTTDQVEGRGVIANLNPKDEAKKKANAITLSYYCDETKWADDYTKTEEYGQYVYYNTMADWLYLGNNFETYKTFLFKQVKYVMTGTKYDVIGTEYLSSNCFFDILSIDFIDKMIKMLSRSGQLIDLMINKMDKKFAKVKNINLIIENILNKIIGQCAIYILTKIELKPDNIYPPDTQFKMSNELDIIFEQHKELMVKVIRQKIKLREKLRGGNQPKGQPEFENTDNYAASSGDEAEYNSDEDLDGGFSKKRKFRKNTNKKRTIRKKTNKKRTIRKKTNKKRTIRKKIRHTIFKTKKNHK
jgi:hypothetical protein